MCALINLQKRSNIFNKQQSHSPILQAEYPFLSLISGMLILFTIGIDFDKSSMGYGDVEAIDVASSEQSKLLIQAYHNLQYVLAYSRVQDYLF
jgi:hypothetical protein